MKDGSRHFGDLPETVSWHELHNHLPKLSGVVVTGFLTDDITEAWIDFTFSDQVFSINNQFGQYWFFVDNPHCPDEILQAVLAHCERLLVSG
jgi:hypothetical protein